MPDTALVSAYQADAIYSDTRNIRERHGNGLASCKTVSGTPENENPGAVRGSISLALEDIKMRAAMASQLAEAIADAHPDDAAQIMTAALIDLSAGNPGQGSLFVCAEEDAKWWASIATPVELMAVMRATLERLGDLAMHRDMRKRLFFQLWKSLGADDRARFLAYAVGGSGNE